LNATATPVLTGVNEDAGGPSGAVGTLVSSLVNLSPPSGGLDNVTDADSGAVTGIALTGTSNTNGTWFYSTDNGAHWNAVGTVSNSQSLLLAADADTRLYFQPNSNFNGDVTNAITFRAWDQTTGSSGSMVDTSANGGTTAFSSTTDTANINVAPVNDAPVNTVPAGPISTNEDTAKFINGLSISDLDAGSSPVTVTLSVGHGVLAATSGGGVTVGGSGTASITLTGTMSSINTFLAGATAVAYTPGLDYTGADTLTMVTNDNGNTGSGGSLSDTDTVAITVSPINDAPNAVNDTIVVSDQTTVTIPVSALLGNDSDVDGRALRITGFTAVSSDITSGPTLSADGQSITFITRSNATDSQSFTYTVTDDAIPGAATDTATVTVRIVDTGNAAGGDTVNLTLATYDGYTASYIDAANGTDTANGGLGGDTFVGGNGADILTGGAGNDVLRGGADNDTLNGGDGIDLLDFSDATAGVTFTLNQGTNAANPPSLNWSTGALAGGLGTDAYQNMEGVIGSNAVGSGDILNGSSSGDVIYGMAGNDTLNGNTGDDTLRGGAGNDTIDGGIGIDLLDFSDATGAVTFTLNQGTNGGGNWSTGAIAGTGTDGYKNMEGIIGSAFGDTLTGSAGNDVIVGGAGADTLDGNGGSDTFKFRGSDASSVDTINGFSSAATGAGGDVLDIGDLLIGSPSVTTGNIGDYLEIRESGGNTIVSIDRDGTTGTYGFQDFAVLSGVTGLDLATLLLNGNIDTTP
jgi:Ca2+-binding RTX toxin-like protein